MGATRTRSRLAVAATALAMAGTTAVAPLATGGELRRPAGAPQGGSRTGVSRRVITIGMHAQLSGDLPLPNETMQRAKNIFFRWMRSRHKLIHHRRVKVILKDDQGDPSQAVAACKELVTQDHVFALVGFSGVNEIQPCARYAASVNVPYLAPGTTETGLASLPQTFATSMTWPDQASLMADFVVSDLKGRRRKNAIVWTNLPNYEDAKSAFRRAMRRRKASLYARGVPEGANTSDANDVVQDLQSRGIKNVFVFVSPQFFLLMLRAASQQDYHPNWTGVSLIQTVETRVETGCGFNSAMEGARFFSPVPAFADRNDFDKAYARAMKKFYDDPGDATVWANWAQEKVIARLLRLPGRNLTRKRFIWYAERAGTIKTGVASRVRYTRKTHFGADQVHLLQARCSDRKWHTIKAFVSKF